MCISICNDCKLGCFVAKVCTLYVRLTLCSDIRVYTPVISAVFAHSRTAYLSGIVSPLGTI